MADISKRWCCATVASCDQAIAAFEWLMNRVVSGMDRSSTNTPSLLERAGRIADAERALRGVLAKDPQDANALNSLGYMLADHGHAAR